MGKLAQAVTKTVGECSFADIKKLGYYNVQVLVLL